MTSCFEVPSAHQGLTHTILLHPHDGPARWTLLHPLSRGRSRGSEKRSHPRVQPGWERGMCPRAGRPGSELHVDSAAVFSWENIYKRGLPSLLTPHSPYVPPGSWGHVAMVPRNGELREGKLRCEEPICSRGCQAERGSASGEGPRLQGLAVERTRRGEGAGDPGSEAQGEGDGKRCEEQVSEKAGLGGERAAMKARVRRGARRKGLGIGRISASMGTHGAPRRAGGHLGR